MKRLWPDDWEGRFIVLIMLGAIVLFAILVWMLILIPRAARGADLPMHARMMDAINAGRWKQMCKGAARYEAMREAYELKQPDPCNGGKKWVR